MKIKFLNYFTLIVSILLPIGSLFGAPPIALPNFAPVNGSEFLVVSLVLAFLFILFVIYRVAISSKSIKN